MSIWAPFGTSDFPLNQPMVGQKEFYDIFRSFTKTMRNAGMATIFPLISKWGIGKSRIGFEVISEPLGMDKGWIINDDGEQKEVRIFKPNFEDKVLPLYIRYSQMCHEDLIGDNWVAYGTYTALSYLSKESDGSIQGKIMECIQDALMPMGFDREKLGEILEVKTINLDNLVIDRNKLDKLTRNGIDYIKKFNIDQILIVCDELETAGEIAKYGIEKDKELQSKIDGEAIQVITNAIKHEDPRKKYPEAAFLLLCSTVIGGSIQGIGALDRRTEMYEMLQNSFADISDFIEYLNQKGMIPKYPEGIIEAAYTIAGGNFGWFNVIMHNVDQKMEDETVKKETGFIFENILKSSNRFKESLIDKPAFDYIQCEDRFKQKIKHALLKQIPDKKSMYSDEEIDAMLDAKDIEGGKLFKEFYRVKLKKEELGVFLNRQGYKNNGGNNFINSVGGSFDLEVLLRSLKTFSIGVDKNEFIIGKEEETFLDQIRMLYPKEEVEEAARYIYSYIIEKLNMDEVDDAEYIGPNFAYLSRLNKRYRVEKDNFGYVPDSEKNKEIEKLIVERSKNKKEEVKRILSGACRALELSYPDESFYTINGVDCVRTKVEGGPYLDVHDKKIVDIIWGKDEEKLKDVLLDSKLMKDGVHPVIVISDSFIGPEYTEKFVKEKYEGIGKCLIFVNITRLQKDILEVMSLDKEDLDIRENKNCITPVLRERVRKIRDYIKTRSNEWFDRIDSEGWVLRPILYKKHTDEQIKILSTAFKRMLIYNLDFEELGSKKDHRLSEGEYTELNMALKNVLIGKIYEGQGYKETGLFVKEDDNNFGIAIPHCVNRMIKFNANSNKTVNEYENKFFFSVAKDVKPKKIVEQWLLFMQSINLLNKTQDGFISRTSSYDLNGKYDLVKTWLDVDCKEEIESMKKVINGPYLKVLEENQIPYYKVQLQEAQKIKDSVKVEILEEVDNNTFNNFKEVISKIEEFSSLCNQVYDREMWNNIKSYNPNIIKDIKIDDKDKPLWFRIRHIRLFIDYINKLKLPAEKAIFEKIAEIKSSCVYENIMLPISPITNILQKYCNELQNSTDLKKMTSSGTGTMVSYINTLAYKLQDGDFSGAAKRIEEILADCGLELLDNNELKWASDSGVIGEYKKIHKNFKFIVDGYKKKGESEKWIQYFSDAPESLKNHPEVKNLSRCIQEIDYFINNGFEQEIEDSEGEMLGKPKHFIEFLKKRIDEMYQTVGVVDGYRNNVINLAKTKKNNFRDEVLITTIDKIRNLEGKTPASIELRMDDYPKEKTYEETKNVMENKMSELTHEGETFFKAHDKTKKVTFSFYKDVVAKNGDIDWDNYSEEMKELIDVKLIRYKIEV
ncbi:hypothetical protein [Clostridium sporogenes]|uniref:hypothetical protein n=1 Tax=Clostridium sporogenes TaxID=1509 RepID=UPI002238BDEA|nr:hypothetical protein [Clostridium sporogenes]MCW6078091.1 hypothetical protein [Clostridium sporogenes]